MPELSKIKYIPQTVNFSIAHLSYEKNILYKVWCEKTDTKEKDIAIAYAEDRTSAIADRVRRSTAYRYNQQIDAQTDANIQHFGVLDQQ